MTDCIFCKIIRGDIPSAKVYEDDKFIVFNDISPVYPVHALIVPKKHIASVNDVTAEDGQIFASMYTVAKEAAKKLGVESSGYRVTVNTGKDAGQVVHHFHAHLLGGAKLNNL